MRIRSALLLAILGSACGGSGPSDTRLSGEYDVHGTGAVQAQPARFRVISQNDERIVIDWVGGDVRGDLPVRDTAQWNESAYRLDWRPQALNGPMYIVRILGETCTGQTFFGFGNSPAWLTCTLTPI
jgi:hypothetical protein